MMTATPGRCASGNRRNSRCVTDVSHCKTSKLKLDDNSSSPINYPTRSRVQWSSVRTILKLPSVEIKRSDRCNCDNGDTNWWRFARSTKQSFQYKSKYKKSKLVAKRSISRSQYECYSIVARMETYCSKCRNTQMLSLLDQAGAKVMVHVEWELPHRRRGKLEFFEY